MKNLIVIALMAFSCSNALGAGRTYATPTPIPTPAAPLSPGTVSVTCLNCTKAQSAAVPALLQKYQDIRASQGFVDYLLKQTTIDQARGLTNTEILAKLRTSPIKTTLSFYSVPWYQKPFHPECGQDADDGSVTLKVSCYDDYTDCKRVAFFAHEFAHYDGFVHVGNKEAGNEHTVPYLVQYAILANCK